MNYDQGNADELRHKFWGEMEDSPLVMLQLDDNPDSSAPMTAQLDKHANSAIWFFTYRDNHFAKMGPANATFTSKGHDLFAHFNGVLSEETSRERLEKEWSNTVKAWIPGGKDDPKLLMMRMDLGHASIWSGKLGALTTAKMHLGMDVTDDKKGGRAEIRL